MPLFSQNSFTVKVILYIYISNLFSSWVGNGYHIQSTSGRSGVHQRVIHMALAHVTKSPIIIQVVRLVRDPSR